MENRLIYDWYSCSVDLSPSFLRTKIISNYDMADWVSSVPKNGYLYSESLMRGDTKLCQIFYGGDSQGTMVFCEATGEAAPMFAELMRADIPHRVSRVDIAIDFNEPMAWVNMHTYGVFLANRYGLKDKFIGSSGSECLDSADIDGRSLYLGSRQSVGYVRMYEKGKKDNPDKPNWVRFEYEFKPKGDARYKYSTASKAEILSSTKHGSDALKFFLSETAMRPCAAGTVRVLPDRERTLRALRRQYGAFIRSELETAGGCVNTVMTEILKQA